MKEIKEQMSGKPTVVIIDDALWPYEELVSCFQANGVNVEQPFKDENEDNKTKLTNEEFQNKLNSINESSVYLVIADQFYDRKSRREITKNWLDELTNKNKDILVVETSFVPLDKKYNKNNPIMMTGDISEVRGIFKSLNLGNKYIVCETMKNLTDRNFLDAQIYDPNNRPRASQLKDGFSKLLEKYEFNLLYQLIGKNIESKEKFYKRFMDYSKQIDDDDEIKNIKPGLILHSTFTVLFYLERYGEDPEKCALSLTRLSNLLGLTNELSE